ncbi:MAG: O-antigen polymerase family protein [Pseudomonadota bacterium]
MTRLSAAWGPWAGGLLLASAVVFRGSVDAPVVLAFATLFIACWGLDAALRRTSPMPTGPSRGVLGLALFTALSAAPLPVALVRHISPRAVGLASMAPLRMPKFLAWSLDPSASLVEAAKWGAVAALIAWVARSSRGAGRARAWAWAVVTASVVGAVLHAAGTRGVGLVNPNHVASLTLLGALLAWGLSHGASRRERGAGLGALLLLAVMTFATGSQAGIASLVTGVGLLAAWSQRERLRRSPARSVTLVLGAGLVVGAGLLVTRDAWWPSALGKLRPWPQAWRMALAHPWGGVGRGAFEAAFEAWTPEGSGVVYTHPENLLLQWVCEWGLPTSLLALVGLGVWLGTVHPWRSGVMPLRAAAFVAVVSVLLHELADFGLETGAVAFAGAACLGLALPAGEERAPSPRAGGAFFVVASALALVGWSALADRCRDGLPGEARAAEACLVRHPADASVALQGARSALMRAADATLPADTRREALSEAFAYAGRAQALSHLPSVHLLNSELLLLAGRRSQAMVELGASLRAGAEAGEVATRAASARPSAGEVEAILHPTLDAGRRPVAAAFLRALGLHHGLSRAAFEAALSLGDEEEVLQEPELFAAACAVGLAAGAPEVETLARQMRERRPAHPGGWWCGSQALRQAGADDRALALLEESVSRVPSDAGLVVARGRLLVDARRPREAEALMRALPQPSEAGLAEQRAKVLYDALMADGRAHRGLAEMRTLASSREPWRLDLLARALADAGHWDEAQCVAREAARMARPEDAARLSALGRRLDERPRPTSDTLRK